jgi:glycosyltransferase involved in cell wall biosynthesis
LCEHIDFTVFAAEFDNPRPDRIRFVRVPVPTRPLALLYLAYHIAILPIYYWTTRIRGLHFDLVQTTETYSLIGDISYSQFCHRHYLREHWPASPGKGIHRFSRWLDHFLRSSSESLVYRRVRAVVVPSFGLDRELRGEYSIPTDKVTVISNPVDLERFARPADFDVNALRKHLGICEQDIVAAFVALGHFERKGLPFIFSAVQSLRDPKLKILVVGGRESLIADYRRRAEELRIGDNVIFVGLKDDVRPYLWCSDLFLFPSLYETFSLVTFQAAAAGLPILAGKIHGIEEFLNDEENGLLLDCSSAGVEIGLCKFIRISPAERLRMGSAARASVAAFGKQSFTQKWAKFYSTQL